MKGNYAVNVDSFSKLLFIKMLFIKIDCAGSTSKIVTRKQHDSTMHCTEIAKKSLLEIDLFCEAQKRNKTTSWEK